jgi:hypothetical protein
LSVPNFIQAGNHFVLNDFGSAPEFTSFARLFKGVDCWLMQPTKFSNGRRVCEPPSLDGATQVCLANSFKGKVEHEENVPNESTTAALERSDVDVVMLNLIPLLLSQSKSLTLDIMFQKML